MSGICAVPPFTGEQQNEHPVYENGGAKQLWWSNHISKRVRSTSCRALADGSLTITQECALGPFNEPIPVSDKSSNSGFALAAPGRPLWEGAVCSAKLSSQCLIKQLGSGCSTAGSQDSPWTAPRGFQLCPELFVPKDMGTLGTGSSSAPHWGPAALLAIRSHRPSQVTCSDTDQQG